MINEASTGPILLGASAIGSGIAFLWAERNSPTSRALASGLALLGVSVLLNAAIRLQWPLAESAMRAAGVAEAATLCVFLEWMRHLSRRGARAALDPRWIHAGQTAALLYGLASLLAPDLRRAQFAGHLASQAAEPGFWLFALPMLAGLGFTGVCVAKLMRRDDLDQAERSRLAGMAAAAPLFVTALLCPAPAADFLVGIGLMVFVAGLLRYHALRGHEGQFLTRFLSPQVLKLIQRRGLREALRGDSIELTAVVCDLRGFTRYTQEHPNEYALQLLRDYYKVVGRASASFGGTLKDFVGDGALILIGAPLRTDGHADVGLSLANLLRADVERMLQRWSPRLHKLGVGIGVATGVVQVGVIASDSRYEYVAVGNAVNLASRLCESAESGQILVAPETASQAVGWRDRLSAGPTLVMKGVEGPIAALLLDPPVRTGSAGIPGRRRALRQAALLPGRQP